MAIGKLLLLLAVATCQHYASTAPNTRPPSDELRKQVGWELVVPRFAILSKALLWSLTLAECSVLFAASDYCAPGLSQSIIKYLVHSSDPQRALAQISSLTPVFLAGSVLSIAGSLLRIHCYRVLGRMFTFELSIRRDHKLVTSWPYSVVRHPSYTGSIGVGLGGLLCAFNRRSWLVACSGLVPGLDAESRLTNVLACTWVSMVVAICIGMMQRIRNEDDMLEKNFGEQWKEWARRVPYRTVPWVY
ncbi:hypothetical protein BU15DRAFT_75161 [Melanogaster broomeanus]|nr:hypothetical protein BU15DRAFT_75161 [Melanogaster broomeanus]